MGAAGLRCLNGDEAACTETVLHPTVAASTAGMPDDLTFASAVPLLTAVTVGTVRPPSPRFLSAIIEEFGRERFRTFWKSDKRFDVAFQEAFHESLGHWTARWAKQQWLKTISAQYTGGATLLGVTFNPAWLLVALVWSTLSVMIAAAVARRRQAT